MIIDTHCHIFKEYYEDYKNAIKKIADIEIENDKLQQIKTLIDQFAKSHQTIKLTFNSVGVFMTSDNVLFLSPVITEELLAYKNDFTDKLSWR